MIAAELRGGNKPSLERSPRLDRLAGRRHLRGRRRSPRGRLDRPGYRRPALAARQGGRFGGRSTLIPFEDATAGAGHVWIPYERDVVRDAPEVEPGAPLTQAVESALRSHYAANATGAGQQGSGEATAATSGAAAQRAASEYEPPAPAPPQHRGPRPGSNIRSKRDRRPHSAFRSRKRAPRLPAPGRAAPSASTAPSRPRARPAAAPPAAAGSTAAADAGTRAAAAPSGPRPSAGPRSPSVAAAGTAPAAGLRPLPPSAGSGVPAATAAELSAAPSPRSSLPAAATGPVSAAADHLSAAAA